jgi:kumamolisin
MNSNKQGSPGGASSNGQGPYVVLPGSQRAVLPGAHVLGAADADEWIEVTLKLRRKKPLPEPTGLPGKVLTRGELGDEYGAAQADIDTVKTVLTSLGLRILKESAASCSIRAGGRASVVESVFWVKLFHYSHPGGNYRGRTGEIHVPAALDGIVTAVFGLDNRKLVKRRPITKKRTSLDLATRAEASRAWFFPAELATIYSFPAGDGQGQTVGLLEFGGGYFASDLATFCKDAGVSVPTVQAVSVNNTPTNQKDGAEDEVMLDVEVVAGVCPAATIVVFFSTFDEGGWVDALDTAVHDTQYPLTVLSCSWGYAEDASGGWTAGAITSINETLQSAALLGVTICVAAGDDGSSDAVTDGHAHVDFPAASPYVLAVGGTTLKKSSSGTVTETAWKDGDGLRADNGGSTGGGVSTQFARPSWQTVDIQSINPGSIEGRVVPDVAADASANTGYWTVVDGQGGVAGGTSAAAPLWASLVARLNASLGTPVGYLSPLLYGSGANGQALGLSVCRDITVGNNDTASVGGYSAGPGYDAVSGWGVPIGSELLTGLKAASVQTNKK